MEQLNDTIRPLMLHLAHQQPMGRTVLSNRESERIQIVEADPFSNEEYGQVRCFDLDVSISQSGSTSHCAVCKDQGYVRYDVPFGHPQFGKAVECRCLQARKNTVRQQILRDQSRIDTLASFQEESFETFRFLLPGVQEAYRAALQFAREPQGWFVLVGGNGCGKTHLAVSVAKRCLDQGMTVFLTTVPDLLDRLRLAFAPTAEETYDEEFRKMREVEMLVLDDLGAEVSTNWATEKLFQLLNYRYNARLATVMTTNQIDLEGIAPRLRSRLRDRRLVRLVSMAKAQDFRELEFGG